MHDPYAPRVPEEQERYRGPVERPDERILDRVRDALPETAFCTITIPRLVDSGERLYVSMDRKNENGKKQHMGVDGVFWMDEAAECGLRDDDQLVEFMLQRIADRLEDFQDEAARLSAEYEDD